VIVMAEKGREILKRVHGADDRKIVMIPHGVPDRAFADPEGFKPLFGWQGREVVLTFGLLAPNKGIETMIEAMPRSLPSGPTRSM
jgi:glycosyltransferase involved in cell wall biosynthesis